MKRFIFILFSILYLTKLSAQTYQGYVGQTIQLSAPSVPGIIDAAAWSSEDNNVVYVSGNRYGGQVLIESYFSGTVRITCTYGSTYYGEHYAGHVYYYITCIPSTATIDKKELTLNVGQKATLKYSNSSGYSLPNHYWQTDNQDIATVNGKDWAFAEEVTIEALKSGECNITFNGHCGSAPVTCKITVVKIDAQNMTLSPNLLTITVGKTSTLKPIFTPSNATETLRWSSSDESVATVLSSGKVTGKSVGTAVITATTSKGIKATAKVNVLPQPTSVSLPSTLGIYLGYSKTLSPAFEPVGSEASCTWTSSDATIVSVSGGKVTGKRLGKAVITVKTDNGKSASCEVTVKNVSPELDYRNTKNRINVIETLVNRATKK